MKNMKKLVALLLAMCIACRLRFSEKRDIGQRRRGVF